MRCVIMEIPLRKETKYLRVKYTLIYVSIPQELCILPRELSIRLPFATISASLVTRIPGKLLIPQFNFYLLTLLTLLNLYNLPKYDKIRRSPTSDWAQLLIYSPIYRPIYRPYLIIYLSLNNVVVIIIRVHFGYYIACMSFRDTFTRSSSSSENLQYDDTAVYYFYVTILLIVLFPLAYSIFKTIANPFGNIPHLKDIEKKPFFSKKIAKFKKENRYNYITTGFVFKILLMLLIIYALVHSLTFLKESGNEVKGFDPYEILEVDPNTPIDKIKKSYRRLALKYHPDRNQGDPQANARFIMISKAYECLTNEQAKQNCLKYGNPEGSASFNVGIALPSFLVKKQNKMIIMGIVFLMVVIVMPIFLIYYFSEVNKYDEYGMLQESHPAIHSVLHQNFSIRDSVKGLSICAEFKNLKTNKQQKQKLEVMIKQADDDIKKVFLKKNYYNFIKEAMVLINARVSDKKIPDELMDDYRFILKKIPVLVSASIMLGLERSGQVFAKYRPELFVGKNALMSLIVFGQFYIQGKDLESQSFQQLDFTEEEIDKIYKRKKKHRITEIECLQRNNEQKEYLFELLTPERSKYIQQILEYFPKIEEISTLVHTAGDKQLTALDVIEIIIKIKSNKKSNFCCALKYPFLKMQGWYVIVSDGNHVVFLEHFHFGKSHEYQVKFNRGPYGKPGSYGLTINVLSDCYYGLDIEKPLKFDIGAARKMDESAESSTKNEIEDESLFGRWMKSMMPAEEEQLSDEEDEPQKTSKTSKTQKND